ncbi:MAG: hypothetical protein HQK89_10040 [Nitrospirae bacterium]|nr:hypothetical protein [Nitrospirota bacterium]
MRREQPGYGKVDVSFSKFMSKPDGSGDCINFAVGLEFLCDSGKVLVAGNLRNMVFTSRK